MEDTIRIAVIALVAVALVKALAPKVPALSGLVRYL